MVNIIANHEGLGTFNRFNTPSFLWENYEENPQNPHYLLYVTYMTNKTTVIWPTCHYGNGEEFNEQNPLCGKFSSKLASNIGYESSIQALSCLENGPTTSTVFLYKHDKFESSHNKKKALYHSPLAVCRGNDAKYYIILFPFDPMTPNLSKSTEYHPIPSSCRQFRTNIPSVASANKKKACWGFRISRLTPATSSH